jgi:hypothetical protein
VYPVLSSDRFDIVDTSILELSRLNTWPARSPVNASLADLQLQPHDSGPMWVANPSSYGTLIHYFLPVLTGAPNLSLLRRKDPEGFLNRTNPYMNEIFLCDFTLSLSFYGYTSNAKSEYPHGVPRCNPFIRT